MEMNVERKQGTTYKPKEASTNSCPQEYFLGYSIRYVSKKQMKMYMIDQELKIMLSMHP